MIGVILALLCGGVVCAVLAISRELRAKSTLARIILGGFGLRLILQTFLRELPFFSHGSGGDWFGYEQTARLIAKMWTREGIHFVTENELPVLGPTKLPANVFALVVYLNDGVESRLGCTALVALAAALTVTNLYLLAVQFGATQRNALLFAGILYFQPAFLFYTSDMYKDGLVVCFTIGALASALRLAFRFSILHAVVGVICVWALWYVRFYLIFVTVAPLLVGLVGVGSKNVVRPVLAALAVAAATLAIASFTDVLQIASARASETFERATSDIMIRGNQIGGSGIEFDDGGSPYAALPAKLAYTIFAPFLWASGSIGFQLGKIDVLIWYFVLYRMVRGARTANPRLVLMLSTFIVPCTLMYAMTMANVGLVVRQRLIIVASSGLLAAMYSPPTRAAAASAAMRTRRHRHTKAAA